MRADEVKTVTGYVVKAAGLLLVIVLLIVGLWRGALIDAESIHDRATLHGRLEELQRELNAERRARLESEAAYQKRGVIQKALLYDALNRKAFSPEQEKQLRAAEVEAKYPGDAFAP